MEKMVLDEMSNESAYEDCSVDFEHLDWRQIAECLVDFDDCVENLETIRFCPKTDSFEYKDEYLAKYVQIEYESWRIPHNWNCENCNCSISHEDVLRLSEGAFIEIANCPSCGSEMSFDVEDINFDSEALMILWQRYRNAIQSTCNSFNGVLDDGDLLGEMSYRFFRAVMSYGRNIKANPIQAMFSTYLWRVLKNRFEDYERVSCRRKRNAGVICKACGKKVGVVWRMHLMDLHNRTSGAFMTAENGTNTAFAQSHEPEDSVYCGHQHLHDRIIERFGRDRFEKLGDNSKKGYAWQNSSYTKEQHEVISRAIVSEYRIMFPEEPLSLPDFSLNHIIDDNETEFGELIPDHKGYALEHIVEYNNQEFPVKYENIEHKIFIEDSIHELVHNKKVRLKYDRTGEKTAKILELLVAGFDPEELSVFFNTKLGSIKGLIIKMKKLIK